MSTILIVDDHALNRQFLQALLGFDDHRVIEAVDGVEGLALAIAHRPDMIITDIMMPRLNGYEFISRMREIPELNAVPVMFYTSTYSMREAHVIAAACGVRWVMQKPSPPKQILAAVHDALGLPTVRLDALASTAAAVETSRFPGIGTQVNGYLRELGAEIGLVTQLGAGTSNPEAMAAFPRMAQRLSQSLSDFQNVSLRLTALIDMGIELASERDPRRLLEAGCRIARQIGLAKYAAIGILGLSDRKYVHYVTRGLDIAQNEQLALAPPPSGIFDAVLEQHRPQRMHALAGDAGRTGLPPCHPPLDSLLVLPIATPGRNYGWLYLGDKLGADQFSPIDEEVLLALATQIAVAYENLELFEQLRLNLARVEQDNIERLRTARDLHESERRFSAMLENVQLISVMLDRDARITYCNDYLLRLTGWQFDEVVGCDWFERFMPPEFGDMRPMFRMLLDNLPEAWHREQEIFTRSGERRLIRWNNSVLRSGTGEVIGTASIGEDITARKQAEEALQSSLREKEALLKEVHHRVKNNLQVITSLLRLESGRSTHADTKSVLVDMQGRIRSMALLHESLYRSGTFASVDLGVYLKQLVTQAFRALDAQSGAIHLHLELASVRVAMDQATPCGLLVNELVSNCLKHGFADGRGGEVRVVLQELDGNQLRLSVSDNGVGLPDDFTLRRENSLGLQLVADLTRQIGGILQVATDRIAMFVVTFTIDAAHLRESRE